MYKKLKFMLFRYEFPRRTYSIGSRDEHQHHYKHVNNATDIDQIMRVRAFSVGARAKIPKCDLQRGVLYPRAKIEQKFNSNNNISTTDIPMINHAFILNSRTDKKSSSAPILVHKSLNSVDVMSDLMEIDFSKTSHFSENKLRQSQPLKQPEKIIEKQTTNDIISSCDNNLNTNVLSNDDQSGYLEMKPVCSTLKSITNDANFDKCLTNSTIGNEKHVQNIVKTSSSQINVFKCEPTSENISKKEVDTETSRHDDLPISLNKLALSTADEYKHIKTLGNVSKIQEENELPSLSNNSQSSQSNNDINSTPSSPDSKTKSSNVQIQGMTNSNNDQQLHYASLDLPQITNDINAKSRKKEVSFDCNTHSSNPSNSYAKIDFDHSDSSSCSSKTLNL